MIKARAITTLGVPLPKAIKKSGTLRSFALVRVKSHAMTHEIKIPALAAALAAIKLFLIVSRMPLRVNKISQYLKVKLDAESGLPKFFVNELMKTVANGIITTIKANKNTKIVTGTRHLPSSTILGLTDFPEIVIYCLEDNTKLEIYKIKIAISINETARAVASVRPSGDPT